VREAPDHAQVAARVRAWSRWRVLSRGHCVREAPGHGQVAARVHARACARTRTATEERATLGHESPAASTR
jgi:hypothetical protein